MVRRRERVDVRGFALTLLLPLLRSYDPWLREWCHPQEAGLPQCDQDNPSQACPQVNLIWAVPR